MFFRHKDESANKEDEIEDLTSRYENCFLEARKRKKNRQACLAQIDGRNSNFHDYFAERLGRKSEEDEKQCRDIKDKIEIKLKEMESSREKLNQLHGQYSDCLFNLEGRRQDRLSKIERLVQQGICSHPSVDGYLRHEYEQDQNECRTIEVEIEKESRNSFKK